MIASEALMRLDVDHLEVLVTVELNKQLGDNVAGAGRKKRLIIPLPREEGIPALLRSTVKK